MLSAGCFILKRKIPERPERKIPLTKAFKKKAKIVFTLSFPSIQASLQPAWQGEIYVFPSSPHTGEYFTKSQLQSELQVTSPLKGLIKLQL